MNKHNVESEPLPVPGGHTIGDLFDLLSSLPEVSAEERSSFARDVEQARPTAELRDPWDS